MLSKCIYHKLVFNPMLIWGRAMFCSKNSENVLKGIDPSKITKRQFLEAELSQNPEFFKAFPHLKPIAKKVLDETYDEKLDVFDQKYANIQAKKKVSDRVGEELKGYFESLRSHVKDPKNLTIDELEKESEINNIDAYHHTEKAKKWMSEKEKEIIHQEIDHKMQELEDTGLTRMEILYNEQKGIPLIDDPVFQYLKNNRIAREMIIKPGEAFTADAVIDKALRQTMEHSLTPNKKYNEQNLINKSENKKTIKEEEYVYGIQDEKEILNKPPGETIHYKPKTDWRMKRKYDELIWETEKSPAFINKPLTKQQAREKYMRKFDKNDFNWKDTALLTQFMTKAGKIKNRYQTRLPDSSQNKLEKTVKCARNMGVLPYVGMISPTDKISLTSFNEDLEEFNKKSIDPVTGKMFYSQTNVKVDKKYIDPEKTHGLRMDKIPLTPDESQLEWIDALNYAINKRKERENINIDKTDVKDSARYMGSERSYEKIMKKLDDNLSLDDLPNMFIGEKTLWDANKLKQKIKK